MSTVPKYFVREVDGPDSEGNNYEIIHRERSFRDVVVARGVLEKPTAQLFAASPVLRRMVEKMIPLVEKYGQDFADNAIDTPETGGGVQAAISAISDIVTEARAALELAKVKP